jgi:hypothetical protein
LPRLALLGLSLRTQARTLAGLPFTHRRAQAVYARMVTPSLETASTGSGAGPEMPIPQPLEPLTAPTAASRSAPKPKSTRALEPPGAKGKTARPRAEPKDPAEDTKQPRAPAPTAAKPTPRAQAATPRYAEAEPPSAPTTTIAADACVLMIHLDVADLLEESDHVRLQRMLLAHSGWRVAAAVTIGGGSAMADQALALIGNGHWEAPPPRIAIIQDGSQPPITEHLRFLRAVRAQVGKQAQMLLALVGDPDGEDRLPPLSEFHFSDWQRKIEQMGDPYLRLEMLAPPAADPAPADEASE